jgi:two-component system, cell cycle response regulator DivK
MATILIIEDDADTRDLLRFTLEPAGHRVLEAATADEGLALACAAGPDVILMDVSIPGAVDGIGLTRRLRADPAFDRTAIVALTAHTMRGDRERTLAAGCDEYVGKPIVDLEAFTRLVSATRRAGVARRAG